MAKSSGTRKAVRRAKEKRAAYSAPAKTVTIHKAKTELSRLIRELASGDVIIARGKTPVARLVAYSEPAPKRRFGSMKGLIKFDDSFFDPLPPEELDPWNA